MCLPRDASEISVGDVLRALEGNLEPVRCAAFIQKKGVWLQMNVSQSMYGRKSTTVLIKP